MMMNVMTTHERFVHVGNEHLFTRHSDIRSNRPSLLFIHGLGESGLCFGEAFSCGLFPDYNLIVPDLTGYGRSSRAVNGDYSFAAQIGRLKELISILDVGRVTLIGHSLGGILGTLWAGWDRAIKRLVNVEGNLTAADATFSKRAASAFEELRGEFGRWRAWFLSEFTQHPVNDQLGGRTSIKRYYRSLLFSRPEPFLANSLEIMDRTRTDQEGVSEIARVYNSLEIPKIYFWGAESLSDNTKAYLEREGLLNRGFPGAGHWPMIDVSDEFYQALADFLAGCGITVVK